MPLKLYDKAKPSGKFALIDAVDVEMPDGSRLPDVIPRLQFVTTEKYKALEEAGEIDPDIYYMIARDVQ